MIKAMSASWMVACPILRDGGHLFFPLRIERLLPLRGPEGPRMFALITPELVGRKGCEPVRAVLFAMH